MKDFYTIEKNTITSGEIIHFMIELPNQLEFLYDASKINTNHLTELKKQWRNRFELFKDGCKQLSRVTELHEIIYGNCRTVSKYNQILRQSRILRKRFNDMVKELNKIYKQFFYTGFLDLNKERIRSLVYDFVNTLLYILKSLRYAFSFVSNLIACLEFYLSSVMSNS